MYVYVDTMIFGVLQLHSLLDSSLNIVLSSYLWVLLSLVIGAQSVCVRTARELRFRKNILVLRSGGTLCAVSRGGWTKSTIDVAR